MIISHHRRYASLFASLFLLPLLPCIAFKSSVISLNRERTCNDALRLLRPLPNLRCSSMNVDEAAQSTGGSNPLLSRSSFFSSCLAGIAVASHASEAYAMSFDHTSTRTTVSDVDNRVDNNIMLSTSLPREASTWQQQTLEESISGFVAGATLPITKTLVKYPLDTATVRLQMRDSNYSILDLPTLLEGSYRGVLFPLLANIPAGAVFFAVKDACKESLRQSAMPRWLSTSLAVGAAQLPYWLVRNPSEVVKTRQQAGLPGYGETVSSWQAIQQVRKDAVQAAAATTNRTDGVSPTPPPLWEGFYVGYWENVLYAFPADVLKFVFYEQLSGGRKNLPPAQGALAGAGATALAQLITTPLDVVRNRLMAKPGDVVNDRKSDSDANEESSSKLNYVQMLGKLAQEEGLAGLFAGATPRVGKAMLSGAIQFATYEETKQEVAKLLKRGLN